MENHALRRSTLVLIVLIGLALRIGYAIAIYEPSLQQYNLDDFVSYRNAAQDILDGDLAFTNSLYMKRPPVYSLMVAALGIQPLLVIAANIALGLAVVAHLLFGPTAQTFKRTRLASRVHRCS